MFLLCLSLIDIFLFIILFLLFCIIGHSSTRQLKIINQQIDFFMAKLRPTSYESILYDAVEAMYHRRKICKVEFGNFCSSIRQCLPVKQPAFDPTNPHGQHQDTNPKTAGKSKDSSVIDFESYKDWLPAEDINDPWEDDLETS